MTTRHELYRENAAAEIALNTIDAAIVALDEKQYAKTGLVLRFGKFKAGNVRQGRKRS